MISYYELKITGKDVKRFLHNLSKMHINFYKIKFENKSVIIKVDHQDYIKIKKLKTIYNIELINLFGVARIIDFFKKYYIFLTVLLFGYLLFLGLTNIVFSIEVVHNNKDLRELVTEELNNNGIKKHSFVVSYKKKEKIKETILKKHKDKIEWMEIERVGTKYVVKLEERKKNNEVTIDTPRNVIAKKNGIIKKIVSSSGEIIGKVDHYVKKGDILISGTIHNKEEEVAKVRAEGQIYAETWYTITVDLPYHYHEEIETNKSSYYLKLKLFNKKIKLFSFKNYKNTTEQEKFILKNSIFPLSLSIVNEKEINIIDKIYTKDNAIVEASSIAQNKLKSKTNEKFEILYEKNLKIDEEDSKIKVVMFYKILEDITDYQDIEEIIEDNVEINRN